MPRLHYVWRHLARLSFRARCPLALAKVKKLSAGQKRPVLHLGALLRLVSVRTKVRVHWLERDEDLW